MSTKQQKLIDWALSKVGCGYIWGATGYTLTQTKLDQVIAKQGANSAAAKYGKKWIGKQCYDCAQLVRWGLKAAGVEGVNISGASSQWNKGMWVAKGAIDTLPADIPCIIFREDKDSSPMGHVGIYMGDGTVVHAQQTKTGVVHTKLSDGRWTHWAIPDIFVEGEAPVFEETTVRTTLRRGSKGNQVEELQKMLNTHGASLVVDGVFGADTEARVIAFQSAHGLSVDGIVGPKTWEALEKAPAEAAPLRWEAMTDQQKLNNLNERLLHLEGGDS